MYRGTNIAEVIKHLGAQGLNDVFVALTGTISSVDPKTYTAKVNLGMAGVETGWLPIGALLTGNGYGVIAIPEEGTEVTVIFDSGDINAGKIMLCNYNTTDPPPQGLNPGEIFAQSKGGASLKLDNQGNVTVVTATGNIDATTSTGNVNVIQQSSGNMVFKQQFRGGSITLETDSVIINNPDPLNPGEVKTRTTL